MVDIVPATAIHENSVFDVDFFGNWSTGGVVLVGDAAHAMTPALGQGGNVELEDALELASILSPLLFTLSECRGRHVARALQQYCDLRRNRVITKSRCIERKLQGEKSRFRSRVYKNSQVQ